MFNLVATEYMHKLLISCNLASLQPENLSVSFLSRGWSPGLVKACLDVEGLHLDRAAWRRLENVFACGPNSFCFMFEGLK